ncbi:hypothetical protein J3Q64DRAFT_1154301 [Phycomyces blakesleeanus]|uniref:Uncharacterized protein n=1 Tax=Phycomyces blakesleeanus TaxID=4837 RepID=A0ABR3AV29_PHYBL
MRLFCTQRCIKFSTRINVWLYKYYLWLGLCFSGDMILQISSYILLDTAVAVVAAVAAVVVVTTISTKKTIILTRLFNIPLLIYYL